MKSGEQSNVMVESNWLGYAGLCMVHFIYVTLFGFYPWPPLYCTLYKICIFRVEEIGSEKLLSYWITWSHIFNKCWIQVLDSLFLISSSFQPRGREGSVRERVRCSSRGASRPCFQIPVGRGAEGLLAWRISKLVSLPSWLENKADWYWWDRRLKWAFSGCLWGVTCCHSI